MLNALFRQAYPLALRSAQVRSAAAVVSGAVLHADRGEVEQELLIRVWQALFKYDPARAGLRTFIEMVVSTQFTSMLRPHRRRPAFELLDERHAGADWIFPEVELRADVGRVLAGVSAFDRAIAFALAERSAVEVSRGMGVSRAAVYRAIGRLRAAFRAAGFAGRHHPYVACRRTADHRSRPGQPEAHQ